MNTDLRIAPAKTRGTAIDGAPEPADTRPGLLGRAVLKSLENLEHGDLILREGARVHRFGQGGGMLAELDVHDARFWTALALRGSLGAGEAYAHRWWSSPDPVAVVRLMVRNMDTLDRVDSGIARISKPFFKAFHKLRSNTVAGSKDNISAHYDLSNEFFELFLDPTMTYSCGIFEDDAKSGRANLERASIEKIDRLCRKLDLRPGERLLEIGTGWGAFAVHAAREYGARVTTTTISDRQHEYAARRFAEAGVADRVTLLKEDYRKLPELMRQEGWRPFDKLVSVEMIEAVGAEYFGDFFKTCSELLADDGRAAIQAITILDQRYVEARDSVDFIKRYIFPGCCIPSVTSLLDAATAKSDLRLSDMEDIGMHYVPTLSAWREALLERWQDARDLGLDDTFLRLFEFYFAYCEGGFAERQLSDVHLILDKPGARPPQAFAFPGR